MSQVPVREGSSSDLRNYLAVVRSRKWIVILVTLLGIGAALALSYRQTAMYRAETRVVVAPVPGEEEPPDVITEAQLAKSDPVAGMVKRDLGTDRTRTSLLSGLTVDPLPESDVMTLSYVSPDPEFAQQAATSFSVNYIQYRRTQTRNLLERAEAELQGQIDDLETELENLAAAIEEATESNQSAESARLEAERGTVVARLGVLEQRLQDLNPDATTGLGGGEIIETADLPTSPFSPNHITNGLLGAMAGLFLGLSIAFARERLDERIHTRGEAEEWLRTPVLATIPKFARRRRKPEFDLVSRTVPNGSAAEAYRRLRTNLQFVVPEGTKSVLVSSPSPREGKTTTTANLAVTLAEAGKRVIVVSADMRRPQIENYFGVNGQKGLSNWLASGDSEIWDIMHDPGIPNLRLIPSGQIPANPAELLSSDRMAQLIGVLETHSDLVLLDTPPVLAVADASILASVVGASVLLVQSGGTDRQAAHRAKEELERAGRSILGVVVGEVEDRSPGYYYTGEYYSDDTGKNAKADK